MITAHILALWFVLVTRTDLPKMRQKVQYHNAESTDPQNTASYLTYTAGNVSKL
jgi:hypothetical protein